MDFPLTQKVHLESTTIPAFSYLAASLAPIPNELLKNWKQKERILFPRKNQFQLPYSTRNFPVSGTGYRTNTKKVLTTLISLSIVVFTGFPSITILKRRLPFSIWVKSQFNGKHVPMVLGAVVHQRYRAVIFYLWLSDDGHLNPIFYSETAWILLNPEA